MPAKTMQSKNKEALREMTKTISPVLAINNPSLRPYIEIFEYHPENIVQQPLGSLVGFFEIKDYSDDSAYVVNFLTSVLKKEYYANPKRSVTESFDSALHKVNVALSEVVKHGNMGWLGHIDGAVCILEKNSLHLSVTGSAQVLLARGSTLADISEDLAPEKDCPNPLKTFINVSSGRMENADKILITSSDIFHIFSLEELKKNIQRFEKEKFVQLLKTALSNELEMAGTIVVDFSDSPAPKKTPKRAATQAQPEATLNAFSSSAFVSPQNTSESPADPSLTQEETEPTSSKNPTYTDKKTGHIYITGEEQTLEKASALSPYLLIAKERALDWSSSLGQALRKSWRRTWRLFRQFLTDLTERFRQATQEVKNLRETARFKKQEEERLLATHAARRAETANEEISLSAATEKNIPTPSLAEKNVFPEENPVRPQIDQASFGEKSKPHLSKILSLLSSWHSAFLTLYKKIPRGALRRVLPSVGAIGKRFANLPYQGKVISVLALTLIIFGPALIAKIFPNDSSAPAITQIVEDTDPFDALKSDQGIRQVPIKLLSSLSAPAQLLLSDLSPLVVTSGQISILNADRLEPYPLPEGSGNALHCAYMDDLDLALILTDTGKIISFSPISRQYKENAISLPSSYQDSLLGTYLTYLYLLDETAGQIYRYPRAEGGFGEKTEWLREPLPFAQISSLALDDSIYLSDGNSIAKFFRGKKEALSFENSTNPVRISALYAHPEGNNLYALDGTNSRIVSYAKTDGKIMAQYFNTALSGATRLVVDEKNRTAYALTPSGLISVKLE